MPTMSSEELEQLRQYVRDRYAASGKPPDVVEALNEHNDRVLDHCDEIARGEGLDADETQLLKTIAILHDAAKADTHLMLHAEAGAETAREQLEALGKEEAFIAAVQRGIECHMGPFPFIEEEAEKYEQRTGEHLHFPRPSSKIEKLFYDADMLALVDIEGVEKVVVLRSTTPEFIDEDERAGRAEGITPKAAAYRSALRSCERAANTMFSDTGRNIATRLMREAERHVAERLSHEHAGN